jgi:hypothetical protein
MRRIERAAEQADAHAARMRRYAQARPRCAGSFGRRPGEAGGVNEALHQRRNPIRDEWLPAWLTA